MNIKKIIREALDDFDWARDDVYFSIDYILGKQMYFRHSNINELEREYKAYNNDRIQKIPKNEIVLGNIKWTSMFTANYVKNNIAHIYLQDSTSLQYSVDMVEFYVNSGIWALEDDNGNIINDFSGQYLKESEGLDWIQKSEPDRKDIRSFNKERYKTTLNYDNAEIGDKFIPPGSHMVWTVDDKEFWRGKWGNDENGDPEYYRYFVIWIKNERGDIKRKYYNETNKLFPSTYRPWRKIVDSNINESEEFDWAKEIKPEMTAEAVPLYYNKPLYWYHEGKPLSQWGMPTIYWISKSYVSQRGENISLLCYKDMTQLKEKIECSAHYDYTLTDKINRGELVFQPQLSDIEPT